MDNLPKFHAVFSSSTLTQLLCFPSVRLLRSLSSSLDVGEGNVSIKYLTRKAQCLEPHERVVNIKLDEIHIKSKLSYQSKKLSKLN